MKGTKIKLIEGKDLSLEEYLEMLLSPAGYMLNPSNQFPTSGMLNQFLETAKDRPDREIKSILHAFFLKNATFKLDLIYKEAYQNTDWDEFKKTSGVNPDFDHTEHFKRLIAHEKPTDTVWEGVLTGQEITYFKSIDVSKLSHESKDLRIDILRINYVFF